MVLNISHYLKHLANTHTDTLLQIEHVCITANITSAHYFLPAGDHAASKKAKHYLGFCFINDCAWDGKKYSITDTPKNVTVLASTLPL